MIRVLIVDDHDAVRNALAQLLAGTEDLCCVGTAADGDQAVAEVARLQPDVVLMDHSMPGTDGVTATRRLLVDHPKTHVLVLTSFGDQQWIVDALEAGAEGYLLKHSEPEVILAAVRDITVGRSPLDSRAARVLIETQRRNRPESTLTGREFEVLRMLCDGQPNKAIARRMDITERTVKTHLTTIYQKLGVTERNQAVEWARLPRPRTVSRRAEIRSPPKPNPITATRHAAICGSASPPRASLRWSRPLILVKLDATRTVAWFPLCLCRSPRRARATQRAPLCHR